MIIARKEVCASLRGCIWCIIMINALTAVGELMTLIDFTLSNARRFYSSMGNPLAVIGLKLRPSKRIPEDPSEFLTFLF